MLTLPEVFERMKTLDEITLLEVLQISSEALVDRFEDYIEDHYEELAQDVTELYEDEK